MYGEDVVTHFWLRGTWAGWYRDGGRMVWKDEILIPRLERRIHGKLWRYCCFTIAD